MTRSNRNRSSRDRRPEHEVTMPAGTTELTVTGPGSLSGGLTLPIGPGCTTVVGPNGAGKGRLLTAIAEAWPSEGEAWVVDVATTPDQILAEVRRTGADERGRPTAGADRDATFLEMVREELAEVVPEVLEVGVDGDTLVIKELDGLDVGPSLGVRSSLALAACRLLARDERGPEVLLVEEPAAFLHPLAQEQLRERIVALSRTTGVRVVISSETTFVVPRGEDDLVVAVARAADGALEVVGQARGDDRHADLVGGLFRDPGLAVVLDRAATLGPDVRGVLVFEGGTDEAYLRLAAAALGRERELDGIAVVAAGGASAAALQAVVLRAETALPLLVVLDNDDPGQRARETLVKRLSFQKRHEVTSYAEVLPGYPEGAEAEDMFDHRFVGRFVKEVGGRAITGQRDLWRDVQHYDLTSWAKSAFVRWAEREAEPRDVEAWGRLLDILAERLASDDGAEESGDAGGR